MTSVVYMFWILDLMLVLISFTAGLQDAWMAWPGMTSECVRHELMIHRCGFLELNWIPYTFDIIMANLISWCLERPN